MVVPQVKIGGMIIEDLDGHFTLMYVYKKALPELQAMLEGMEKRISALAASSIERSGALMFHEELAQEYYAWADLLVASPLHGALHAVVAAGLQRRRSRSRNGLSLKLAFHLSIRTNANTRMVDAA